MILGILKHIFIKNEIEDWSELPKEESTRRSTTPRISAKSKIIHIPSLCVGSLINWVQLDRFADEHSGRQ